MTDALPPWLDRTEYPFAPRSFETADGRMHYVDEGEGAPILLVHGTPTWSFLYRSLIRDLFRDHRVIAPDHLGFGLSGKPREAPYRPADHARRLEALVEHLALTDVTLAVHDFGGPIGLSWALRHPDRVRSLILFNTWMWRLADDRVKVWTARLLGGPVGRVLYERLNLSPRLLLKAGFADASRLTPEIHRHYTAPFPTSGSRRAPWVLARELLASSEWYRELWKGREALREKPALLLWGMKDPAFGPGYLDRWTGALPNARVVRMPEVGHFPQEEAPERVRSEVRNFLGRGSP